MADSKISALPASTTPLAGTEVLPIVQSSTTKKVAVSDLTAGRSVSMKNLSVADTGFQLATLTRTGISGLVIGADNAGALFAPSTIDKIQFYNAAITTQIHVFNTANGDITNQTGNYIPATAAKGINFTANTPAAGMTSQLLNWYEEGTWTPTIIGSSTAGTGTYSEQTGSYTRIGRQVTVTCAVTWSAHTGTGVLRVSGLPFTIKNDGVYSAFAMEYGNLTVSANAIAVVCTRPGTTYLQVDETVAGGASQSGVTLDTAASLYFSVTYFV